MEKVTITVTCYSNDGREGEMTVEWPAVPRIGEKVEMRIHREAEIFPVRNVLYLPDGHVLVRVGNYDEGKFLDP